MKKVTSILISLVLLTGMLLSVVSAGAVYQVKDSDIYFSQNKIIVFLKQKYKSGSYSVADFPELSLVKVEKSVYRDAVALSYAADSGISMQDALERVAKNPMAESVFPDLDCGIDDSYCFGDVNLDSCTNAKDITLLMKYLVSGDGMMLSSDSPIANQKAKGYADANGDGVINAKDITQVMRWILEG